MGDSENTTLENIQGKIQSILDRSFKERYRKKIEIFSDRWNFACPVCGDSSTDIRKKRGNLYLSSMNYHCYNCGCHMGVNSFLRKFGEGLSDEDRIAVHEIQQSSKKFERTRAASQSSMSFRLLDRVAVPKAIFFKSLGIESPYKNKFASDYLRSRKIDIRDWKYFAFNDSTKELYILNTTKEDRVIGYQVRQLNPSSKKARYMSRSLSRMYDELFRKDVTGILERILLQESNGDKYIEEEDGMENIVANLDRLSGMFNIMNVNLSGTLTILEGPIDSLGVPNSIALQGATKTLNGFFDGMNNVRYLFDNDKVGKEMSIKKLKEHKPVFLWDMYLKTIDAGCKVKDVNDLQKKDLLFPDKFEKCFSDDEFDVMYI